MPKFKNEKVRTHSDKINEIKFFAKHHESLSDIFHRIRISAWVDMKEDREIVEAMMKIERFMEVKMLQKDKQEIHIDKIEFEFEPICAKCGYDNSPSIADTTDLMEGPIICVECKDELVILPYARIK